MKELTGRTARTIVRAVAIENGNQLSRPGDVAEYHSRRLPTCSVNADDATVLGSMKHATGARLFRFMIVNRGGESRYKEDDQAKQSQDTLTWDRFAEFALHSLEL